MDAAFEQVFEGTYPHCHPMPVDGLWLGDQSFAGVFPSFERTPEALAEALAALKAKGIGHIVCCSDGSESFPADCEYYHITMGDRDTEENNAKLRARLPGALRFIDAVLRPERSVDADGSVARGDGKPAGGVFVHCNSGISRSGSVVVAYLMYARGLRFEEALRLVSDCRHVVMPGFDRQLIAWEGALSSGSLELGAVAPLEEAAGE